MDDQAFCIDILPRVSRTFALSIEALPEPLRSAIRTSYLLCRIVDTIEDDPDREDDERQALFDEFSAVIESDRRDVGALEQAFADRASRTPDHELCASAGAVFRQFRALDPDLREAARPAIEEMARGMAEYARRWQGVDELTVLRDLGDLQRYCYYVAGTVGNLLTELFLVTEQDNLPWEIQQGLTERSVAFGLGLQMTNIVKDVAADRERGWCFLPGTVCRKHGVEPDQLTSPEYRDAAMAVVGDVVTQARRHLQSALEYTLLLPSTARDVRLFVLVPMVLAFATLELVPRTPQLLDGAPVKVTRKAVALALARAVEVVSDDEGIEKLCGDAGAGLLES